MELWNSNDCGSQSEKTTKRSDELQYQLTQVTDELNLLKMQMSSPQPTSGAISKDIPNVNVSNCRDEASSNSVSVNYSSHFKIVEEQSTSFSLDASEQNDEKDKQIRILSNKVIEQNKEIERLRDIIKQRNG